MNDITLEPLPPREAIAFFRSKGLAPAGQRFDYRDFWREDHARGFVVAKAMRDDVLDTIRGEVDLALSEGRSLDQFRKDLAPKLKSLGWWGKEIQRDPVTGELVEVNTGSMRRLKVIFDTNMRTSYAAGQWARLQRTKVVLPYLEYRQLQRETARDEHKPFHGLILPIDHPIWRQIFPPNGWFCACSVRAMNKRMLEREGKRLTTDAEVAALDMSSYSNPRTGETVEMPDGIDPAFSASPGHVWQDADTRHATSAPGVVGPVRDYDRGYAKELVALQARRSGRAFLALDRSAPEAPPIAMVRDSAEIPPEVRSRLVDRQADIALMRSADLPLDFPLSDLNVMADSPGLGSVTLVSPDGSILRISRTGNTGALIAADIARLDGEAQALAQQFAADPGLDGSELDQLVRHGLLRALAARGDLAYSPAPGDGLGPLLERGAGLISAIVALVVP